MTNLCKYEYLLNEDFPPNAITGVIEEILCNSKRIYKIPTQPFIIMSLGCTLMAFADYLDQHQTYEIGQGNQQLLAFLINYGFRKREGYPHTPRYCTHPTIRPPLPDPGMINNEALCVHRMYVHSAKKSQSLSWNTAELLEKNAAD